MTIFVVIVLLIYRTQNDVDKRIYSDKEGKVYDTIDKMTRKVFMDIKVDGDYKGRIIIALFGDTVPITTNNFAEIINGERISQKTGKPLSYKMTPFHRIVQGFMAQGGDFTKYDGTGGESIYRNGAPFPDENFKLNHSRPYLLSMANAGPNTNKSQFFITFEPCPWLDGKHVVFGEIVEG